MKIQSCSSTESANCINCGNSTGNYKIYRNYGIKIYIPLCSESCFKFSANKEFDICSKLIKDLFEKGNKK